MFDLGATAQIWLWKVELQVRTVLGVLRYQLVALIGQHRGTVVTALALLAFVVAAFILVYAVARFVGILADKTKGAGHCRHGRPLGNRTKNFCPQCAMEKSAAEEIHARLRDQRARRARNEE